MTGTGNDAPLDLRPREVVPTAVGTRRRRPWLAIAVLVAVVAAGGVMVYKFLSDAIDYYCNVDEVGVKDGCDVGRSIRIQGVVDKGSVSADQLGFVVSYHGVSMPVRVSSKPTGIFQECIPVVVSGRAVDDGGHLVFDGDEVIVKHDNTYDAANAARLTEVNTEAAACSQQG